MSDRIVVPPPLERMRTGVAGLDAVLGGGIFEGGLYILTGRPGAGKTTLANQMCFTHVAGGGRATYVSLLTETHGRMLANIGAMRFFDPSVVGTGLRYINGFTAMESQGLTGLLELLRRAVREHQSDLLVLDGMVTVSSLAGTAIDFKRFIAELQSWVGVMGCTVLFLTSEARTAGDRPEHTMVDGIVELSVEREGMRTERTISVSKFRGSGFAEGEHPYAISDAGLTVYPRLETLPAPAPDPRLRAARFPTGIEGFDALVDGGFAQGSVSLGLGSTGAGKSIFGTHVLAEGLRRGERCLHFGFYEMPPLVVARGEDLGMDFSRHEQEGRLTVRWNPPAERTLDGLVWELLETVERLKVQRLFIDGLVGFKAAAHSERISQVFSVLSKRLTALGVTTLITDETRELFIRELDLPTQGVSAIFDNILLMRQIESDMGLLRLVAVMKTRDTPHDRKLYRFEITGSGIVVREPFERQGALQGMQERRAFEPVSRSADGGR